MGDDEGVMVGVAAMDVGVTVAGVGSNEGVMVDVAIVAVGTTVD